MRGTIALNNPILAPLSIKMGSISTESEDFVPLLHSLPFLLVRGRVVASRGRALRGVIAPLRAGKT